MPCNDTYGLIGLTLESAETILSKNNESYKFVELKNHRQQYDEKRVVRLSILPQDEGELLVVEYTGFPTLEDSY